MALLYRAFYAIPGLSTHGGEPTNAVFGFIRMVTQVMETFRPTHAIVAFDGGLSKEKLALLSEYKAQRPPMPEPLRSQVARVEEYLDCAGIARIRVPQQEADDVMASLATWAERERVNRVLLATNDKDLFQLVDDRIAILTMPPSSKSVMGPEEVRQKTGVAPAQIPAWLALTGDASDNIPGVPGVGAKTAAKLLAQFGSIESIFEGLDKIAGDRIRRSLEENRDVVARNMKMVVLQRDLPCGTKWDDLLLRAAPSERLVAFLEKMEFHSMAKSAAGAKVAAGRTGDLFPGV
jgi:DNA polymerase-1